MALACRCFLDGRLPRVMPIQWRQRSSLIEMRRTAGTVRWICDRHGGRSVPVGGEILGVRRSCRISRIVHLRTQNDELFPALCDNHLDTFPRELYTWKQFLWACELWYSNSMKVMFPDGKLKTCLIPIAGFLNHLLYPHILHFGKTDPATNSLKFCLSRPCSAGEQCFLSYGNFSSSHLITLLDPR